MLRCLLEGLQWLIDPAVVPRVAGDSAVARLGWLRQLHDGQPIAVAATGLHWRLVSLDGSTMDVADEQGNEEAFGRPGASRGSSAYPQFRFVSLVESGTHVLFGTPWLLHHERRNTWPRTSGGWTAIAWPHGCFGFEMWQHRHSATQAQLL